MGSERKGNGRPTNWLRQGRRNIGSRAKEEGNPALNRRVRIKGMSRILTSLEEIAGALELDCRNVGPEFLRVGKDLETLLSVAHNLSEDVGSAVQGVSGDNGENGLFRIGELARDTLVALEDSRASVKDSPGRIRDMVDCLGDLYTICDSVERISMVLGIVGLNMGVESSRSVESRELFHVVSQETKKLSERIIDITKEIRIESSSARNNQISILKEVSSLGDELHTLQKEASDAVTQGSQHVEELIAFSLETLQDAEKRSSEISRQIGDTVVVIQLHDSVAQRIEHMSESLREVRNLLTGNSSDKAWKRMKKEVPASVHAILKLQAGHLREIIHDIEEGHRKAGEAFGSIYGELKALVRKLSSLNVEGKRGPASRQGESEDPFVILGFALQNLRRILGRGRELIERVKTTTEETAKTTKRVADHMVEVMKISNDTHIMAINAIVKAAHLGEKGQTLEVLAQEVRKLSDQSEEFVKEVQEILTRSRKASQELRERAAGELTDELLSLKEEGNLDTIIHQISLAGRQFKEDSRRIFECAETVSDGFRQRRSSLDFLSDFAQKLRLQMNALREVEDLLSPLTGRTEMRARDTLQLAGRYTMNKEWDIHRQIVGSDLLPAVDKRKGAESKSVGGLPGPKSLEERAPHSSGQDSDLGDNVELF